MHCEVWLLPETMKNLPKPYLLVVHVIHTRRWLAHLIPMEDCVDGEDCMPM